MLIRDTESGRLFQKRVTFTGPKETRRKNNALDIHEFLVGGDKKGNLDLEIAHKNDIPWEPITIIFRGYNQYFGV